MYNTKRYKTACKRNRTKQTIYAIMGLINYHINTTDSKDILYPCEVKEFNNILLSLSDLVENWQKVAPAYVGED